MKFFDKLLDSGSARIIPLSFLAAILIGTLLLSLPIATVDGSSDVMTALFTATTSVCVTGLVVVDTFAHWTLFGKIVILILIQIGGLGVVTVMSFLMLAMHRKFSLHGQLLILDTFNLKSMGGLMAFLRKVVISTFIVEGIGALLYMIAFIPQFGIVQGIWQAVFTSISAFCNAGIDIIGPYSLITYQHNFLVLLTTTFLIVSGGLGYIVWFDIEKVFKAAKQKQYSFKETWRHLNEHSKLVLYGTCVLLFGGAALVFLFERNNPETIGNMSLFWKLVNSFFQSVTFRTAGFAAIPQGAMRDATCIFGCLLMFIGGSPVGTAGGVKTVVFFVLVQNAVSYIRNASDTVLFRRRVSDDLIHKATAIIFVAVMVVLVLLIALLAADSFPLMDALYEVVSAICTVGLSRGITSSLNVYGRIIIIIAMYLGRIGPISMALFFSSDEHKNNLKHANGRFVVG